MTSMIEKNQADDPLGMVAEKAKEMKNSVFAMVSENFENELKGLKGFNSKIRRTIRMELS